MSELSLPTSPPATPEVAHILDDVFTLCRIPFVHDFLFTADPVADISILTAPVQNEHAIAARLTVSGTENTASFAHVFDFSSDFFFCSIPAFSVGPVTVGFATQEKAADASHAALNASVPIDHVSCSRYARHDEHGVFLLLSENPDTGITEVDCHSHRSTRRRTRVLARFRTGKLRANLRSAKGVLHPDDLAKALCFLNVCYERRACPICCAADAGECSCVLPFQRPAHPLDFRNERQNMRLHTGLYEGGCTVRLFNDSLPYVITNLTTRSIIKGSLDSRVISRLNKYAVQDRMAKLRLNPFSPVASLPATSCAKAIKPCMVEGAQAMVEPLLQGDANAPVMLPDESFLQDTDLLQSSSLGSLSFGDDILEGAVGLIPAGLGSGTKIWDVGMTGEDSMVGSERGTERSNSMSVETEAECGAGGGTSSSGGMCGTEKSREWGGEGIGAGGRAEGKELRALLRKQRNRAAAAKSNMKRKIRNERLRRDLAEVGRRATELRAMEKVLREENVRLRQLATQREFEVSKHLTHIQIARS